MAGRVLGIECATEACSAALFEDGLLREGFSEILGRGHAERLVPMIQRLPGKGRAERIVVSLGPGSFTGVRIGLAVGRALGLAWNCEVLGYPTLALVAAQALDERAEPVTVCMAGGHGEWFVQDFSADGRSEGEAQSLSPEDALESCRHPRIVGSKAAELAQLAGGSAVATPLLPDARSLRLLAPHWLTAELAPIYGRPPDATLPGARK